MDYGTWQGGKPSGFIGSHHLVMHPFPPGRRAPVGLCADDVETLGEYSAVAIENRHVAIEDARVRDDGENFPILRPVAKGGRIELILTHVRGFIH